MRWVVAPAAHSVPCYQPLRHLGSQPAACLAAVSLPALGRVLLVSNKRSHVAQTASKVVVPANPLTRMHAAVYDVHVLAVERHRESIPVGQPVRNCTDRAQRAATRS